jgi:uncharacterized circularly permuted ATP-grasp superfamily protein/uncharacterized alpha-E superfamily protein
MTSSAGAPDETKQRRLAELTAGYRPLPGIPDEFIDADGRPRAHWLRFLDPLSELHPDSIEQSFAVADRHILDTGATYRVSGETQDRDWPLGKLPMLIGAEEWRDIAAGVSQRARLIEMTLDDIYGAGDLVRSGALPAALVAGSPDYLRPMQGVAPPGGRRLHLYAADLGRGPDGRWWVLGDRTQAPSGAGYALVNRIVLSRAFPALYRQMNVERLAPFFETFRAGLAAAAERSDPRICLFTPGLWSDTYFEQAWLARYLGFLLVEGGDLVMRDGQVHIRTIDGLKRADVLWRRVDADFADPLELNAASHLGVPGLVEALRKGGVVVANALGAGLAEAPALMSFLPGLARRLLGEDLRLPNIATWWCGQKREREDVIDNLDRMAVASAFGRAIPGARPGRSVLGADLHPAERDRLIEAIRTRGVDFVGQEVVSLSTTPVWDDGQFSPRPFVLRVYATPTPDGWRVMSGGFCRVSDHLDARAVTMGAGVRTADVWVVGDAPVLHTSLMPARDDAPIRRIMGTLPSRAADNMFWLGRYLERTEATLRLTRALAGRKVDDGALREDAFESASRIVGLLVAWGALPEKVELKPGAGFAAMALSDAERYGSARNLAGEARRIAGALRERLSSDVWRIFDFLDLQVRTDSGERLTDTEAQARAEAGLRAMAAISGLSQENMNRAAGWRFLDMGRRLERAIVTCRFARHFAETAERPDDLETLLDLADSQITYRARYLGGLALAPVRDLALLDPYNPRSVAFQTERIGEHLAGLPPLVADGMMEEPLRLQTRLAAELSTIPAQALDNRRVLAFEQNLLTLAEAIAARYFQHGLNAARIGRKGGLA